MSKFEKYASIENSYRQKFIELIKQTESIKDIWFASEKLHGSNFSIIYKDGIFNFASRSGILEEGASFFNYQEVVKLKLDGIREYCLANSINDIIYYGEIFGPGIQKGVNYGKKDFRFFDIKVDDKWIKQSQLPAFQLECLELVPTLAFGSFDEMINFNCEFNSHILNTHNNFAEGIVLKPDNTAFLDSEHRIILKKKHPKFSEIAHGLEDKPKVVNEIPQEVMNYITLNRLQNVFSKIEPKFQNFNTIKAEYLKDIQEELIKDGIILSCNIDNECAKLIREELKKC